MAAGPFVDCYLGDVGDEEPTMIIFLYVVVPLPHCNHVVAMLPPPAVRASRQRGWLGRSAASRLPPSPTLPSSPRGRALLGALMLPWTEMGSGRRASRRRGRFSGIGGAGLRVAGVWSCRRVGSRRWEVREGAEGTGRGAAVHGGGAGGGGARRRCGGGGGQVVVAHCRRRWGSGRMELAILFSFGSGRFELVDWVGERERERWCRASLLVFCYR